MSETSDTPDDHWESWLFKNGSVSLYHRPDLLRDDLRRLADRGYVIHQFTAAEWEREDDFHEALRRALELPDFAYEGRNINAFNDRLWRVELPSRCALVFWGYEKFTAREPNFAQWVLDVFEKHSRSEMFWGKRLATLLQSDDVALRFDPIGACPVGWAQCEASYVYKKRWSEGRNKST